MAKKLTAQQKQDFKNAAANIANMQGEFACITLKYSSTSIAIGSDNLNVFRDYFAPKNDDDVWWGKPSEPENQLARSLALLLVAEIGETCDH